ncbi:MAG TPA: autotransporter outer membrane beta-barrel domain-containing protein [Bauldia sp.]|nr:autotransporter outer membrane beta-barrel domain-containing protein [Bauldia sp.]
MAMVRARGAIRVGRRSPSKGLIIRPAKSRKGLLLGSSFGGGALMVIGATLAIPNVAQAACATNNGTTLTCATDTTTGATSTATGNFTATIGPASPATFTMSDGILINLNPATATLGFVLKAGDSTHLVTVTSDGNPRSDAIDIEAPSGTAHSGNITVTTNDYTKISTTGSGRDGIRINEAGNGSSGLITVNSASTIDVLHDGIHIDAHADANTSTNVTVTSSGKIDAGRAASGGDDDNGISVETAKGNINVTVNGDIVMHGGTQAAVWSKTQQGSTTIDINANIGASGQSTGGAGVFVLTGASGIVPDPTADYTTVTLEAGKKIYASAEGILVAQYDDKSSGSPNTAKDSPITVTSYGLIQSKGTGIDVKGWTTSGTGIWHQSQLNDGAADSDITITTKQGGQVDTNTTGASGAYGVHVDTRGGSTGTRATTTVTLGDKLDSYDDGVNISTTNGNVIVTTLAGDNNSGDTSASEDGGKIKSYHGDGIDIANTTGDTTIDLGASLTANTNSASGVKINSGSGTVSVTTESGGTITANGTNATGVNITSTTGAVTVETNALVSATSGDGIVVKSTGANSSEIKVTNNGGLNVGKDGIHIEETGAGSTGKVTVRNYGNTTSGGIVTQANGISVQTLGGEIDIATAPYGTIDLDGGNQSAIWAKSASGKIGVNVGADIGSYNENKGGIGILALAGKDSVSSGIVNIAILSGVNVYSSSTGIVVGQNIGGTNASSPALDNDITITSAGFLRSGANGIQVGGFTGDDTDATDVATTAAGDSNITITTEDGGKIDTQGYTNGATFAGGTGVLINTHGGSTSTRAAIDVTLGDTVQTKDDGVNITTTNGNVTVGLLAPDTESSADAGVDGGKITANSGQGVVITNDTGKTTVNAYAGITAAKDGIHIEGSSTDATTGKVTVDLQGAVYAGSAGGSGNVDWNGISVQTAGGDIDIDTSGAGNIVMQGGNQAAVWAKSNTGKIDINVNAGIGTSESAAGGSGIFALSGNRINSGSYNSGGEVDVTLGTSGSIYTSGVGILVAEYSPGTADGTVDTGSDINITSSGAINAGSHGIQIGGFNYPPQTTYHISDVDSAAADSNITVALKDGGTITSTGGTGNGIDIETRGGGTESRATTQVTVGDVINAKQTGIWIGGGNSNVTVTTKAGDGETDTTEDASAIGGKIIGQTATGVFVQTSGSATVTNNNHIEGGLGDGIWLKGAEVGGGTIATITNNSLNSVLGLGSGGTGGVNVQNYDQVVFDNSGGLTAGLGAGFVGASITGISGDNVVDDDNVVDVDNTHGGIIVGALHGLVVGGVGAPDEGEGASVYVDNSGYWSSGTKAGGFIAGLSVEGGHGVDLSDIGGSVVIDNSLTRNWGTNNLADTAIDPLVGTGAGILSTAPSMYEGDLVGMPNVTTALGLNTEFRHGTGIWGGDRGIYANGVDGGFTLYNHRGQVIALDDGSIGIELNDVSGGVNIDNSTFTFAGWTSSYALVLGSGGGAKLTDIAGGVTYNNNFAITYGHGGDGLSIATTEEDDSDVNISNAAGAIESYGEDAISIAASESDVKIDNQGAYGFFGGAILGGKSAIAIGDSEGQGAYSAEINNGFSWPVWDGEGWSWQGGLIASAGKGSVAVIYANTSDSEDGGTTINNAGIIANLGTKTYTDTTDNEGGADYDPNLPGITLPIALSQTPGNLGQIYYDAWNIGSFAASAGSSGSIANVADYANAAQALAIASPDDGGSVKINNSNTGLIYGRVDVRGVNEDEDENDTIGNVFTNYGKWFVLGDNYLTGSGINSIHNEGLIQTAFGAEDPDTTFHVADFYNDTESDGVVSMINGVVGNHTIIDGNFHGSTGDGATSYVGIDVSFDAASGDRTDRLTVNGTLYGKTKIIVNDVSGPGNQVTDPIRVLEAHDIADPSLMCSGGTATAAYCTSDNVVSIAENSANYQDFEGYGTLHKGVFRWFMQEQPDQFGGENLTGGRDYYLVPVADENANQQPVVATILQAASLENTGLVEDHEYGDSLEHEGGGGADDVSTPKSQYLWGRITGAITNRSSRVTQSSGGPSSMFDTDVTQRSYSVTAGLEFRPPQNEDVRFGLYGGYVNAEAQFASYGDTMVASGASVGSYMAFVRNHWYADTEVKADFLNIGYNSSSLAVDTKGVNIGVVANTGYRFEKGANFFEPIASFTYLHSVVDTAADGTATVAYNNGDSIRGGLGARLGTTIGLAGAPQLTLDVTGKVWDEFGGVNSVTVSDTSTSSVATVTSSNAGITGEVTGRATVFNADHTASSFLSVGGRFGSGLSSVQAKIGLRRKL